MLARVPRLAPLLAFALACAPLVGCSAFAQSAGPRALSIMPGVVNREDNRSLRFALLEYGLREVCTEMLGRSVPLSEAADRPPVGRFFPRTCESHLVADENQKSFTVRFGGDGYAWTNLTLRVGFEAAAVVEYAPDFLLDGGAMYVYFRTRQVGATSFRRKLVESTFASVAANAATALLGMQDPDRTGQRILGSELARGFTVIRQPDGSVDFAVGIVEKGAKAQRPYEIHGEGRVVLANERVEVHANQREFLGPFRVDDSGRALFLTASLDGTEAVDVLVVPKEAGDPWLDSYIAQAQPFAPAFVPALSEVLAQGQPWRRTIPLPKGSYYVVIDHTATAGRVAPTGGALGDKAAAVAYAVELGDAP